MGMMKFGLGFGSVVNSLLKSITAINPIPTTYDLTDGQSISDIPNHSTDILAANFTGKAGETLTVTVTYSSNGVPASAGAALEVGDDYTRTISVSGDLGSSGTFITTGDVLYAAPTLASAVSDVTATQGAGDFTVDHAAHFTGDALTFTLQTPVAGVSYVGSVLTIDRAVVALQTATAITVRVSNNAGAA